MTDTFGERGAEDQPKSNAAKGQENLEALQDWLDDVVKIPARNGKANISAIAVASGLERQVLYREEARAMIAAAVKEKGLEMPGQQRTDGEDVVLSRANRLIHGLEQRMAAANAEIHDLRTQLRRYQAVERHFSETGVWPR
jgi:hypothetical protein